MVMQRRHFEYAAAFTVFPARVLEVRPLDDNGNGFHKEHTAQRRQQELLLDQDS